MLQELEEELTSDEATAKNKFEKRFKMNSKLELQVCTCTFEVYQTLFIYTNYCLIVLTTINSKISCMHDDNIDRY